MNLPVTPKTLKNPCVNVNVCAEYAAYFVVKFSASGQLLYSTYLFTGDNQDWYSAPGKTLAVDANGHAILVGGGSDILTTANAFQTSCFGACSFLVKLAGDGSGFHYSTYLGGTNSMANGIAVGPTGDVYIAGQTTDVSMTTTPGAYQYACPLDTGGACKSGYLARINMNLSEEASLVFSTYLGAFGGDSAATGVAVDLYGDAYVVGVTSTDIPYQAVYGTGTAPNYQRGSIEIDGGETFVAKLDGTYGQLLREATLLRGATGAAIAVDNGLNTYVTGAANKGLLTSAGAFQQSFGGKWTDAFVTKLDLDGYYLAATFLGGSQDDVATDIALNANNMPFITGSTYSSDLPLGPGGFGNISPGSSAFFVGAFSSALSSLVTSSFWSGNESTWASGIALDPAGNIYLTGATYATNLPVSSNAYQRTPQGQLNAFVTRIVFASDLRTTVKPNVTTIAKNGVVTYNAQVINLGPDTSYSVVFTDLIPTGMSYAGVSVPNGNGCTQPKVGATKGTVTCSKAALAKGQTYYVNVYLRAVSKSGTKITNTVSATAGTQDLWPANNSATSTVKIR